MSSRAAAVAEGIKNLLTGSSFSQAFTAVRAYRALYLLKELKTLRVTVVTSLIETQQISRSGRLDIITSGVVVQKHVDHSNNEEADSLLSLLEEISEFISDVDYDRAIWIENTIVIPFDPDDLIQERIYTGVIQVKHQVAWIKD